MAKRTAQERGGTVVSSKLARMLGNAWCERILMELSARAFMSPSQFVREVGGEISEVARSFRRLADAGLIEFVGTRAGPKGGTERLYRIVHRAHLDTASWELLPRGSRRGFSNSILESYSRRITEAIDAGTFDIEPDRHLSWTPAALDQIAWHQLCGALDEILDSVPALETKAAERMAQTSEESIPATLHLASFCGPPLPEEDQRLLRPLADREGSDRLSPEEIDERIIRALASRWRARILMELSVRPISPSRFYLEFGGSMSHIARCFRSLREWGLIEIADERRGAHRRGAIENVYRLVHRAHLSTQAWERLPLLLRTEFSGSILESYFARVSEAIEADTLDAQSDRHLSWAPTHLDRAGWSLLIGRLDAALGWLPTLESEAARRLRETGDQPMRVIAGLAAFRSPRESKLADVS